MEWLYLGGADYMLLHDVVPIPEEEKIFWADPKELHKHFPELEVVADFNLTETSAYGKHGRLLRFRPQPGKLASLQGKVSLGRNPSPGNRCLGPGHAEVSIGDQQIMREKSGTTPGTIYPAIRPAIFLAALGSDGVAASAVGQTSLGQSFSR